MFCGLRILRLSYISLDTTRYCMVLTRKSNYDTVVSTITRNTQHGFELVQHLHVLRFFKHPVEENNNLTSFTQTVLCWINLKILLAFAHIKDTPSGNSIHFLICYSGEVGRDEILWEKITIKNIWHISGWLRVTS